MRHYLPLNLGICVSDVTVITGVLLALFVVIRGVAVYGAIVAVQLVRSQLLDAG